MLPQNPPPSPLGQHHPLVLAQLGQDARDVAWAVNDENLLAGREKRL